MSNTKKCILAITGALVFLCVMSTVAFLIWKDSEEIVPSIPETEATIVETKTEADNKEIESETETDVIDESIKDETINPYIDEYFDTYASDDILFAKVLWDNGDCINYIRNNSSYDDLFQYEEMWNIHSRAFDDVEYYTEVYVKFFNDFSEIFKEKQQPKHKFEEDCINDVGKLVDDNTVLEAIRQFYDKTGIQIYFFTIDYEDMLVTPIVSNTRESKTDNDTKTFVYPNVSPASIDANLSNCKLLSDTLDYLVIYDVQYKDEYLKGNPGSKFWKGVVSACVSNSWFGGLGEYFYEKTNSEYMTNEDLSKIAFMITGKNLTCTEYPDNLHYFEAYSPIIDNWERKNVVLQPYFENGKWILTYDFEYTDNAGTEKPGIRKVTAIIEENSQSALDGYSIIELQYTQIQELVYIQY